MQAYGATINKYKGCLWFIENCFPQFMEVDTTSVKRLLNLMQSDAMSLQKYYLGENFTLTLCRRGGYGNNKALCFGVGWSHFCKHLGAIFQIQHKCPLALRDGLSRIDQGHCDLTKHVFAHNLWI